MARPIDWPGYQDGVTFSADGEWLIFSSWTDPAGNDFPDADGDGYLDRQLFVARLDGSEVRQLTHYAYGMGGVWPQSGPANDVLFTAVAPSRDGTEQSALFRIRFDGTGLTRVADYETQGYLGWPATWSPDGRTIAYEAIGDPDLATKTPGVLPPPYYAGVDPPDTPWVTGSVRGIYAVDPDGSHKTAVVTEPNPSLVGPSVYRPQFPPAGSLPLPTDLELLQRYRPRLKYDSQESYYADSAAEATDNYVAGSHANRLHRQDGTTLASADPAAGPQLLSLDFLRATQYPSGLSAQPEDRLDEAGSDYVGDAGRMHANPNYGNKIYGRVAAGSDGDLWLQYWFYYYYNDFAVSGQGTHEGDWEMIQLHLDRYGRPTDATYNRHDGATHCEWSAVEHHVAPEGDAPVVYVGAGSHASYYRPGVYPIAHGLGADWAVGTGDAIRPNVELLPMEATSWTFWPGRWGNSGTALGDLLGLGGDSPPSPGAQTNRFVDPAAWDAEADDCDSPPGTAETPTTGGPSTVATLPVDLRVAATRQSDRTAIDYSLLSGLTTLAPELPRLVLTVDSPTDELPPATYSYALTATIGRVLHPLRLKANSHYVVRASIVTKHLARSKIITTSVPDN